MIGGPEVGDRERATQRRVVERLGGLGWRWLGDWRDRDSRNVEPELLRAHLTRADVDPGLCDRALHEVETAAADVSRPPYEVNKAVYDLLRWGVKVRREAHAVHETVWPIDWRNPLANDFAVAEEVTVLPTDPAAHAKRPDLVLYVNGVALGVIELKRASVDLSAGVRQMIDSQTARFIPRFFSTVQLVFAANDTQGLRYGTTGTPERHWLQWREDGQDTAMGLDAALGHMLTPARFLELVHDFVVFDAGVKKTCRHNQYFGVKAAQEHVRRREGGIVWHTQGSGKSLTMTWLARWLRETVPGARVLVVTDREELDSQIEGVFAGVGERIVRAGSGAELVAMLDASDPPLMCGLVHKFGRVGDGDEGDAGDTDAWLADLRASRPKGFSPKGELFVFVDECHRTQSGKLNRAMRDLLPRAMFIGFTGTPLLRADKATSLETWGPFIHTYKFDAAVRDRVVLDLRYEARDVDQWLGDQFRVDEWFDTHTAALTATARAQVQKRWGTLRSVLSSKDRLDKIVMDVLMDFEVRPRLLDGRGNAILVTASIYQACKLWELFEASPLAGETAIVTSYRPSAEDIKGEASGEGDTEAVEQFETYKRMLGGQDVEAFEKEAKRRFKDEPGRMRLLIVVDKLLTGFDAPPATYLYIDKKLQNHGLFQAICRVNRLDGDDKDYGYVIDYRDLFGSLEKAVADYTGGEFEAFDREDVEGLVSNRLARAGEDLEAARETLRVLVEDVEPPRDLGAHLRLFGVGHELDAAALEAGAPRRLGFYRQTARLVRTYAGVAPDLAAAGYEGVAADELREEVRRFTDLSEALKIASADTVDLKRFEPAMRRLIDTYVRASDSQVISTLDDRGLIELIVERGAAAVDSLPATMRREPETIAEAITNNVRRVIIDRSPTNPRYYERMSDLLDALIRQRREGAIAYADYLASLAEFIRKVDSGAFLEYPAGVDVPARRALYDNLGRDADLAIRVDAEVRRVAQDGWRANPVKTRALRAALRAVVPSERLDEIMDVVRAQNDYAA